jgi:hypothetical protein
MRNLNSIQVKLFCHDIWPREPWLEFARLIRINRVLVQKRLGHPCGTLHGSEVELCAH